MEFHSLVNGSSSLAKTLLPAGMTIILLEIGRSSCMVGVAAVAQVSSCLLLGWPLAEIEQTFRKLA